jgi:hypothetical protein
MPDPVRNKNADGTVKSDVWWLRNKVPRRYRALVGSGEVWRSLETTDRKTAVLRCIRLSADLEKDWEDRLRAAQSSGRAAMPAPAGGLGPERTAASGPRAGSRLADQKAPAGGALGLGDRDAEEEDLKREYDEADMDDFLSRSGHVLNATDRARFLPMFVEARKEVHKDLTRVARHRDFSESAAFAKNAPSPSKQIDFPAAFEFYYDKAGIKGRPTGATAKRWRPKIKALCGFIKHTDLGRVTTDDGYRWVDHLVEQGIVKKSTRDVWIASLKAVASFMVERRKLEKNPFSGIRIRGVKATKGSNKKGFSDAQAEAILTAPCATPSDLTTPETRAARRWVRWICVYTGAHVNEIISLLPPTSGSIRTRESVASICAPR